MTDAPWWRRGIGPVPVRLRITAAVVVVAGLALTVAGFAVYGVQAQRINADINAEIRQEIAEFESLQRKERFDDLTVLVENFLERNIPAEDELLIGYWDGAPQVRGASSAHPEMAEDPLVLDTITDLRSGGGSRTIETVHGDAIVAVKTVQDGQRRGAFVHVYFTDEARAGLTATMRTYALVAGLALLLLTVLAWIIAGRLLAPVRQLRDTARDISESDLTRRIEASGNDDLTELTQTFNAMLDRLEGAFTVQRQFLDDAGHELRTPITIVRGHLELLDHRDADEVLATRTLLLDEMDRMSRLVDDLIVLAKAQRPDFIRLSPTDLGTITDDVAEKMRGLAPRQWTVDARASGKARLDHQRVSQALLQLASNAVRHTDEHGVIAVGSMQSPTHVRFWVRDDGEGIAPEDQQRVFERFTRGVDGLRDDGSGLGLAIVNAIVAAHGGHVELESAPGHGATFTLVIPTEDA